MGHFYAFEYVNIPQNIFTEIKAFGESYEKIIKEQYGYSKFHWTGAHDFLCKCPITARWMQIKKLEINDVAVFSHTEHSPAHVDRKEGSTCAINIPIKNFANSQVEIYHPVDLHKADSSFCLKKGGGTNAYTFDEDKLVLLEKYDSSQSVILNTQIPHKSFNFTNKNRVMVSIRPKNSFVETSRALRDE